MDLLYLIETLPYNIVPPEKSFMFRKISHKTNKLILDNNIKLPIYIKPNINLLVLCDSQKNNCILEDLEKLVINYNIIKLELPDCKIGKNNVERLTKIIKTCPNLTYLNLCNNKFQYDEFIIIGKELKELKSLKYIDFSHNHIEIYMDMIIFKEIPELFLLQNNSNLEELTLNNNRLGPRGAIILSKILPQLPKLKLLDISHNSIRLNGATFLAETLGKLTSLTKLDLTENFIESSGAQRIADVLPCCSSLTCLKLKNNW
jgi:Ran GTPase-activating protein (RanGAP) involved in mRNA processing and transport